MKDPLVLGLINIMKNQNFVGWGLDQIFLTNNFEFDGFRELINLIIPT
jgi:hypothetical protein